MKPTAKPLPDASADSWAAPFHDAEHTRALDRMLEDMGEAPYAVEQQGPAAWSIRGPDGQPAGLGIFASEAVAHYAADLLTRGFLAGRAAA